MTLWAPPCHAQSSQVSHMHFIFENKTNKRKKTAVKMLHDLNSLYRSVFEQLSSVPCWGSSENLYITYDLLSVSYTILRHESFISGLLQKWELQAFLKRWDYKINLNLPLPSIELSLLFPQQKWLHAYTFIKIQEEPWYKWLVRTSFFTVCLFREKRHFIIAQLFTRFSNRETVSVGIW